MSIDDWKRIAEGLEVNPDSITSLEDAHEQLLSLVTSDGIGYTGHRNLSHVIELVEKIKGTDKAGCEFCIFS